MTYIENNLTSKVKAVQVKLYASLSYLAFIFAYTTAFNPRFAVKVVNIIGILWLLTLSVEQLKKILVSSYLVKLLGAFTLWIFITILLTTFEYQGIDYFKVWYKHFLFPVLILLAVVKQEHLPALVSGFIFGMFTNEIISYGMHFGLIENTFLGMQLTGDKVNPIPFAVSHIEYTTLLAFAILITVYRAIKSERLAVRIIYSLFSLSMITNIFITLGRTGQAILILSSICLALIYFRNNKKYIFAVLILLIAVFTAGYNLSNNVKVRADAAFNELYLLIKDGNYYHGVGVRYTSYLFIPDIIKEVPIWGYGFNSVDKPMLQLQIDKTGIENQQGQLHQTFITILASSGLVGFFIFIYFGYKLFICKITNHYISYIRYAFLFTVIFNGFSSTLFGEREILTVSALFTAIIIIQNFHESFKKQDERLS